MGEESPEIERNWGNFPRRTVLKTVGAGTAGGAMLSGSAAAQNTSQMNASEHTESDNEQMSTYLFLFDHTAQRRENIGGLSEAIDEGIQLGEEFGAELRSLYFGSIGPYDGFAIAELPDTESAEAFRLAFEREGTHTFEMFEIWAPEEYLQLVERATDSQE